MFYLDPTLQTEPPSLTFEKIMQLKGICFRKQQTRLTQKITIGHQCFFIKQHVGIRLTEIVKNLCFGRLPIMGAQNEWRALTLCHERGISAPKVYGYGAEGKNPLTRRSFILMEALENTKSLETVCASWRLTPPTFKTKQQLIHKIAKITRDLHAAGINHRDLYICHFLMRQEDLYLIDLHRAQIRKKVPKRWLIKDLAALYFSTKTIHLTMRDYYRFFSAYYGKPLAQCLKNTRSLRREIIKRGEKLYASHR